MQHRPFEKEEEEEEKFFRSYDHQLTIDETIFTHFCNLFLLLNAHLMSLNMQQKIRVTSYCNKELLLMAHPLKHTFAA